MSHKHVIWCDEATLSKDLSGNVYIVTGANSGVGLETTRQLVKQGGHVVMACRRPDAGHEAAKLFDGLRGSFEVIKCDLADLQSVRDFVTAFKASQSRLDGLMCNAGMVSMKSEPQYTGDGFEGCQRYNEKLNRGLTLKLDSFCGAGQACCHGMPQT